MNATSDIDQLNAFLREELSAVDAYTCVIGRLPLSIHRLAFASCRGSHVLRVTLLRRCISELGGAPAERSVAWRGFANAFDRVTTLGEHAAIEALEEGEARSRKHYARGLSLLTAQTRPFVARQLLPEQERTQAMLGRVRRHIQRRVRSINPIAG